MFYANLNEAASDEIRPKLRWVEHRDAYAQYQVVLGGTPELGSQEPTS